MTTGSEQGRIFSIGEQMGEIASLLTSICWVLSIMSFTAGGERVGSKIVNRTRLIFGFLLLGALNLDPLSGDYPFQCCA